MLLFSEATCTCWTVTSDRLSDGCTVMGRFQWCKLFVHCAGVAVAVLHWQYLCLGPEVCTLTELEPAMMTLQLYVTVVRCSQTGWIETSDDGG